MPLINGCEHLNEEIMIPKKNFERIPIPYSSKGSPTYDAICEPTKILRVIFGQ